MQLPAGAREGPRDKVPGTSGQRGDREEELGQMEDFVATATRYSDWNQVGNTVAFLFVLAVPPEPAWWP